VEGSDDCRRFRPAVFLVADSGTGSTIGISPYSCFFFRHALSLEITAYYKHAPILQGLPQYRFETAPANNVNHPLELVPKRSQGTPAPKNKIHMVG
jgi:hypothetical protein